MEAAVQGSNPGLHSKFGTVERTPGSSGSCYFAAEISDCCSSFGLDFDPNWTGLASAGSIGLQGLVGSCCSLAGNCRVHCNHIALVGTKADLDSLGLGS